MDINHIELPAFAVAELYPDSLVGEAGNAIVENKGQAVVKEEPLITETPGNDWRYLGDNNKKILVVLKSDKAVHLPDAELKFLTEILGACKLSLGDVAIVNIQEQGGNYKELTSFFKSRIVLLFDIEPSAFGLPMNFPNYQIQAFAGNSFLYAPSLDQLEHDRVEKSKLWVCLKRLFNL